MILSVLPLESITDQTINVLEGDVLMLSMHNGTEIIVSGKQNNKKNKKNKRIERFPRAEGRKGLESRWATVK